MLALTLQQVDNINGAKVGMNLKMVRSMLCI